MHAVCVHCYICPNVWIICVCLCLWHMWNSVFYVWYQCVCSVYFLCAMCVISVLCVFCVYLVYAIMFGL